MVDLAKPAYKLGLAAIEVGVEAFRLKVDVTPEKADYQPRDKAQVKIRGTQPDGKPVPAGTEIAFAAVDQALLELRPNESWKLLDAMLPTRAYQVETGSVPLPNPLSERVSQAASGALRRRSRCFFWTWDGLMKFRRPIMRRFAVGGNRG